MQSDHDQYESNHNWNSVPPKGVVFVQQIGHDNELVGTQPKAPVHFPIHPLSSIMPLLHQTHEIEQDTVSALNYD